MMAEMSYAASIDSALAQAMAEDPRIILFGEDVHMIHIELFARFGADRVRSTPISEAAFVGAAVTAAMGGLRPVAEVIMVDFLGVAIDALLNHAAKIEVFSGGRWQAPLVVRTTCGGGYGDGGQHEQALWGWLAHIPGLSVVVPSTPADAGALILAAVAHDGPVIFLEHKLLSERWRDSLGSGGRKTMHYDIPAAGEHGPVPGRWAPLPLGQAATRRTGSDLTMVSLGVGVHRCIEAAQQLDTQGITATVIDLRSVAPLDEQTVCESVAKTGRLLVVDEDYRQFGLSGELAAVVAEAGIPMKFGRVCTDSTIPYARHLEDAALPNTRRIVDMARQLMT